MAFSHDFTNMEAYPWLSICLTTFGYWWLMPLLSVTSKSFKACIMQHQDDLKVAFKIRGISRIFLAKAQQLRLKNMMSVHLWLIWSKSSNRDLSQALASIIKMFSKAHQFPSLNKADCMFLELNRLSWIKTLNFLIRLAVWMHHYGMSETTLYMLFMTRMDIGFKQLKESYPYAIKGTRSFSEYISRIVSFNNESKTFWLWSLDKCPVQCPIYSEMREIWYHGNRDVYHKIISSLPNVIQAAIVLISVSSKLNACTEKNAHRFCGVAHGPVDFFTKYIGKCK